MENHFVQFSVAISKLNKCIQKLKAAGMQMLDMKAVHTLCLYQLLCQDGMTSSQIGASCDLDAALVSRILSELTARDMIRKEGAPERYNARYYLTPAGEAVARYIQGSTRAIQEAVSSKIPQEDLDIFYRVLYQLADSFGAAAADPGALLKPQSEKMFSQPETER